MSKLKARIKATGEIITVTKYTSGCELVELLFPTNNGDSILDSSDVVFLDEEEHKSVDWEQRRYDMVKSCLTAVFGNVYNKGVYDVVRVVDSIIERLKGGEQ